MGSYRTVLDLEDISRAKISGLGLEKAWPWHWPQTPLALALSTLSLGNEVRCYVDEC